MTRPIRTATALLVVALATMVALVATHANCSCQPVPLYQLTLA